MSAILDGLDGVVCLIDDVLVYGKDLTEHDSRHPDKVFAIYLPIEIVAECQ